MPDIVQDDGTSPELTLNSDIPDGPYRLWGEWTFYFSEDHNSVEAVPRRQARFHLNSLKFLEDYCTDCLEITQMHNNGDSTIDLTVKIKHPFEGHPEYTGFDVKGIIMFNGSHVIPENGPAFPLYPDDFRVSFRMLGDPELLNADGYTYRWSPSYDSGSTMPIFSYWEGKYANGTPTANVNGYLDFYSNEDRHMFEHNATVSRTYRIWLPPGPVVAGYAVEACWELPTVTPVTNPAEDFPISANQPEAYHFKVVINDGNPVIDHCCAYSSTVYEARAERYLWYRGPESHPTSQWVACWNENTEYNIGGMNVSECDGPPDWLCLGVYPWYLKQDKIHQLIAVEWHAPWPSFPGNPLLYPAFDVYEVEVDMD